MAIKVLQPTCNLETVKDGRGGYTRGYQTNLLWNLICFFLNQAKQEVFIIIHISSNTCYVLMETEC